MSCGGINRREFVGLTAAGLFSGVIGRSALAAAGGGTDAWDPDRPLIVTGRKLNVQPVLMYRTFEPRQATSWKSWGGVQTEQAAAEEAERISKELDSLAAGADFPLKILPVVRVKAVKDAVEVHKNDYDVVIVYPATGSGDLLRACFAAKKDRDTIVFVRHDSGPIYYWYEALSVKYLRTDEGGAGRNSCLDHGGVHVDDVVVDDCRELLWRLRAVYGIKNFTGARIVALGGAWGKCFELGRKLHRLYRGEELEGELQFTWEAAASEDEKEAMETLQIKWDAGKVPTEQRWRELGYTEEEIDDMRNSTEVQAANALMNLGMAENG